MVKQILLNTLTSMIPNRSLNYYLLILLRLIGCLLVFVNIVFLLALLIFTIEKGFSLYLLWAPLNIFLTVFGIKLISECGNYHVK